jgi:hypothetical protein
VASIGLEMIMNCIHWSPSPHLDLFGNVIHAPQCTHPHAALVAAKLSREFGLNVPTGMCPLSSERRLSCLANPSKIRLRIIRT